MSLRGDALDEHLRRSAADLFYAEGIVSTGMDRVAEVTGVTKKTMYRRYPSKDALVAAALEHVSDERLAFVLSGADGIESPVERMIGVFEGLARAEHPGFRGCPYLNAAAETGADHPVHAVARAHKEATRRFFADAAAEAELPDPEGLAYQLTLLLDGVLAEAALFGSDDRLPTAAVDAARALVAAAR